MTDKTKEKEKIKFNIVSANWKAQQEWGMAYNTSTTSQAFIENRGTTTALKNPMPDTTELPEWAVNEAKDIVGRWGYEESYWWQPIAKALVQARAEERSILLLELLQVFNDYDVPLTMTAEQVRDILEAYLTKKD